MFVRLGTKIINTANIIEADIYAPGEWSSRYSDWTNPQLRVVIKTTGVAADWPTEDAMDPQPYKIILGGEDAEKFLAALPVYEPVLEGQS